MNMVIRKMTQEDMDRLLKEHREMNPEFPIQQNIIDSLNMYVEHGVEPGGFLVSVLSNNLFDALGRADSYNRASIFQITQYIYNELPSNCWGSIDVVIEWIKSKEKSK